MSPPHDLLAPPLLALARERTGRYDPAGDDRPQPGSATRPADGPAHRRDAPAGHPEGLDGLHAVVDRVTGIDVDGLDDGALVAELQSLQRATRRLQARSARLTATLTARRVATARRTAADEGRPVDRAGERAAHQVRTDLADQLGVSPSEVRRAQRVGDRLATTPDAAEALDRGAISPRHLELLDQTLTSLTGDVRRDAERELLDAARIQNPVAFRRTCIRLLARLDGPAAIEAQRRREGRRRAALRDTDDGMLSLTAQLAGVGAEVAATAIHAFRRRDAKGEHRTAEQRTADALVAALQASLDQKVALDDGAPVRHGVRPHIAFTVDLQSLTDSGGTPVAEGDWTGPVVWEQVRRLLDDAGCSFVTIGDRLPVEVTSETRTVPVGLYRALVVRDGGCIADGCDLPPQWCQTMHLQVPYRRGGRLRPDVAALGCTFHHRLYDAGRLVLAWTDDGRPVLRPPPDV